MNEHAGWLVHDEQVIVLIPDIERQRLGDDIAFPRDIVADVVAIMDDSAYRDDGFAVDAQRTGVFEPFPERVRETTLLLQVVTQTHNRESRGQFNAQLCRRSRHIIISYR